MYFTLLLTYNTSYMNSYLTHTHPFTQYINPDLSPAKPYHHVYQYIFNTHCRSNNFRAEHPNYDITHFYLNF